MSELVSDAEWDETVAESAENVQQLTAMWPEGHRLHDVIPGMFAMVIAVDTELDTPRDEVERFVNDAYVKAGMPGHRHAQMASDAAMGLLELAKNEAKAA